VARDVTERGGRKNGTARDVRRVTHETRASNYSSEAGAGSA